MKNTKHKAWAVGCIVVSVVVALTLCANRILTRIICTQLDNGIAQLDTMDIRYGDIRLAIWAGKIYVNDVYLQTDTLYSQPDSTRKMARVEVGRMSIDGINYLHWFTQRALDVSGITIEYPQITSYITTQKQDEIAALQGDELREQMAAEQAREREQMMQMARVFVEEATIRRISVKHAHIDIHAINSPFYTHVDDASIELNGIGYSFIDSIPYHYNDSIFHFDIRDISITLPDGHTSLHCNGMTAEPGGIIHIDTTKTAVVLSQDKKQYVNAQISGLRIGGFDVQKFNQTKALDIRSLHIDEPWADVHLSTKPNNQQKVRLSKEEQAHHAMQKAQQDKRLEEIEQQVMMFLTEVVIDTIQVHNISGHFSSTTDHLKAGVDSLSLGIYGVGYSLLDSIPYHYNDSVYTFHIGQAHIITPDSLMDITTRDINYTNGGAFSIGKTRVHHTCDKWALGALKGNTPQAWIDLTLGELRTSQKNVVREALTLEGGFALDTINVRIDKMYVFKDNRYKPNKPYSLPQEAMLAVDYPFHIHRVNASIQHLNLDVAMSREAIGHMELKGLHAQISNITAVQGETIDVKAKGKLGKGTMDIGFKLKVNKAANWEMAIDGKQLNMHDLDGFLYPIVGMRIGCDVKHLSAHYGGDSNVATGTFCMEYSNLTVVADKESPSPIKVVAKMSGLINSFARTCLPKQNPAQAGMAPRAYNVKWKNDPWKEPALFYIGPVINGAVETMLPGLFVANQTKNN